MRIAMALACGLLAASAAQAQDDDRAFVWTTATNGGVHYLIYSAPAADNPRLDFTCFDSRQRTVDVRVYDADSPDRPSPRRLTLASGPARLTARGHMALADPTPGVFLAEAPLSSPVFARFRRTGALTVTAGARRVVAPASAPEQRRAVEQFLTRCSAH